MKLFTSKIKTKFVFAVDVASETLFINFDVVMSESDGSILSNSHQPEEITDYTFSLVNEDKAKLFENLSDIIVYLSNDFKLNNNFNKLLEDKKIDLASIKLQKIDGSNVIITPFSLKEFLEYGSI
jgi:hypothetical protein